MFRQGEIVITPTQKVKGSKLTTKVIREGEMTGHKHEITEGDLYLHEGTMFLRAGDNTVLQHPEHKPISIPKGDYQITIQREYDERQNRSVMD